MVAVFVEVVEVVVIFLAGGEGADAGVVQSGGVEARPALEAVNFAVAFELAGVHAAILIERARDGLALRWTGHFALDEEEETARVRILVPGSAVKVGFVTCCYLGCSNS